MRRQFGDRKTSRRTEGPEGDFVGPQTLFAWDLDSSGRLNHNAASLSDFSELLRQTVNTQWTFAASAR